MLLLLDLLEKKNRFIASKEILSVWNQQHLATADPIIIHTLMDISRTLHDTIDSLTFDDERRQCATLIIAFIRSVDHGRDVETQLNFLVDCRAAFMNLDVVNIELIHRILLLAARTHFLIHGTHTKKTAAFIKSCLACVHVTIPSCEDHLPEVSFVLNSSRNSINESNDLTE